ncbi:MAG: oligosaccharide flippase family protein, partial [Candidatus Hodarchaeota archaeon]
ENQIIANTTLSSYNVAIVSNVDLSNATRTFLLEFVNSSSDKSIIFLIDENTDGEDLKFMNITADSSLTSFDGNNSLGYGICKNTAEKPALTNTLPWNTLPEIYQYTVLDPSGFYTVDASDSCVILKDGSSENSDDVFLFYKNLTAGGQVMVFTIWFDYSLNLYEITESWPYLGFFFYSCMTWLEGGNIPQYADWPQSSTPKLVPDIVGYALFFGSLAIGSFVVFIAISKYCEKHPLKKIVALETEEEIKQKKAVEEKLKALEEVNDQEQDSAGDVDLTKLSLDDESLMDEELEANLPDYLKGWHTVGLHRQIGGFWSMFFIMLALILPVGFFFLWLFPEYIFPSPSGLGYYNFVVDFFGALWVFADLGTSVWMTRNFAAYRVKEPEKAIKVVQCFLWFQVLSGAFQIITVGFLGAVGFPHTIYAHLTFVFTWYSIFQWLGFFLVYINILNSLQRTDVAGVGFGSIALLTTVFQVIIVPFFIQFGQADPRIGTALGGAIGSSIANFATNLIVFFVSWKVFQKTFGYSGKSIYRVDFDWSLFKDMLQFGFKYVIGQAFVPIAYTVQVLLLSIYLDNYSNWLGYWNIAYTVSLVGQVMAVFGMSAGPAISEAKENDMMELVKYDIISSMKWMNNGTFYLNFALLGIIGPLITAITPPEFASVATLMPLLILFNIIGPYAWIGDFVFAGLNKPTLASAVWIAEQIIRIILLVIFIPIFGKNPRIGIYTLMFAYIPAIAVKDVLVWIFMKRLIPGLKTYPFKTFIAPLLAGACFYGVIMLLFFLLGSDIIMTLLITLFALFMGSFIYFFLSGLFGGWSENALNEFKRSIAVMRAARKITNLLYKCCKLGAKLSPWREKSNIDTYKKARIEAWQLTLMKRKIKDF